MENLEFVDAVKLLAQRSGLEVPDSKEADRISQVRIRTLSINREAANFYYRNLSGADKRGLQYFASRRLSPATIKKYGLGYAPDAWSQLSDYLLKKGYTKEELLTAGVAKAGRNGGIYDMFRGRVMFPIVDVRGNVIGFGGRVLDQSQPKYLNTAKTPVFDKGSNLFSLNFAKNSNSAIMILAEGYMDVIAINQAGFSNVVATLGTAITSEQARKIGQYAKEVVMPMTATPPDKLPHSVPFTISAMLASPPVSCTWKAPKTPMNSSRPSAQTASGFWWKRPAMPSTSGWINARKDWICRQKPDGCSC